MWYCEHETPKTCPKCGAPEQVQEETITYVEAEKRFKIPEQTIRASIRNHGLREIKGESNKIYAEDVQKLINAGKIGNGPKAKKLKRKRS